MKSMKIKRRNLSLEIPYFMFFMPFMVENSDPSKARNRGRHGGAYPKISAQICGICG